MLPRRFRMTDSADFKSTIRHGRRIGGQTMVLHLHRRDVAPDARSDEVRVGFVVSKAVGNAVVRNRVKRRLRHLTAAALSSASSLTPLPSGTFVVIRALPAAAVSPERLVSDFDRAWRRAWRTSEPEVRS